MQHRDVIIIGAGAAGLFCAATAAARGRDVQVLDHAKKVTVRSSCQVVVDVILLTCTRRTRIFCVTIRIFVNPR